MIETIIKAVKRGNKKRGRNITIGTVIGFLLSCTAVMGATSDNYLWIKKENNEEIKFNKTATTGNEGSWDTANPYSNNNWVKKTYTNNIALSSNGANGNDGNRDISYGLRLSGNLTGVNFINNSSIIGTGNNFSYGIYNTGKIGDITNVGIISGTSNSGITGNGYGYGIYNSSTMGNIENTGVISGTGTGYAYDSSTGKGYGIYKDSGEIGVIINGGIISGTGTGTGDSYGYGSGYGIYKDSGEIRVIINGGIISGTGYGYGSGTGSSGSGTGIDNKTGTMGDITNGGIISGSGTGESKGAASGTGSDNSFGSGGGTGIDNKTGTMKNIINKGVISGSGSGNSSATATGNGNGYGYGIYNSGTMENVTNTGIIRGTGTGSSFGYGYGICINEGAMENITNIGVISGTGISTGYGAPFSIGEGYGIYNKSTMGKITNTGVIYGKTNAIKNDNGTIDPSSNYGILVNGNGNNNKVIDGLDIVDKLTIVNGIPEKNQILNKGLIFTALDAGGYKADKDEYKKFGKTYVDENVIIDYQEDGTGLKKTITKKYTIINAAASGNGKDDITGTESLKLENGTLTYSDSNGKEQTETISSSKGYILNGITNTLKVSGKNNELNGSIINAYGTAVVFGDTGDKELTLSGTIVNGGIDGSAAILGSDDTDNGDTLILQSGTVQYTNGSKGTQNTIVNGNIDMGKGDDTLIIGDGTILNGTLDGGDGNDILNFGISSGAKSNSSESEGVKILHSITGFENMNINTNVTLFEKTIDKDGKETALKVTGVNKITIGKDGNLILRIDGTNSNSHALSNNGVTNGTINSDGGKLLLALNGVSDGSEIDIKMKLEDSMYGVENNDIEYSDKFTLDTTSVLHSVKRKNDSDSEVIVTSKSELPLSPTAPKDVNYEKLNKIYQSMRVIDGVKEFNVEAEKLSIFLGYLNDIYAGNPYSYSSELSRKSVGMFRDIAVESQFKPELNKWLIMGGLTHVDGGTKDTYYGKGYYTYGIGSSDMDTDTKITGAYMLGEYGVSDTLTYGVVIGGNKLKSSLSNDSKVDGDALYMGAYAKKYVGNLKVTGGLGLQYGDYDADRIAAGRGITETRSYSDNYNDMTYDIYLNGRYSHNIGENLFLEPYGTLSYTYIKQDSTDEGSKTLAIETDSKSFDYTAAKVGVDLKKVIPHEKGKSTLSAGVSYTRLLNGADEENITGRFKGGSDFDILVAHKNEHSIGLNAKYALELENGILFDVKGSYSFERDSHNGSGKNRNKGEWIAGTGLGYKF